MPSVRDGLLKAQPSRLMQFLQPYIDRLSTDASGLLSTVGKPTQQDKAREEETVRLLRAEERGLREAKGGPQISLRDVAKFLEPFPAGSSDRELMGEVLLGAVPIGGKLAGSLLKKLPKAAKQELLGRFKTTRPKTIIKETQGESGGYTVHLPTGDVPKEGIMSGVFPNADPRTRVVEGLLKPSDLKAHTELNRSMLERPDYHLGTWAKPDTPLTYLDVSRKFPEEELRRATKFAEKTGQENLFNLRTKESPPVGDYPGFVTGAKTPEGVVPFAQRLQEMGGQGREYMAGHPTNEWWRQPNMERVYGKKRMPQVRGLLAATSTNTQPPPNVVTMSEYARRAIKGEQMIQPEFRVPENALSGPRMPKPGARLGLETGKGGREHNLLTAARGETDPAAYHGDVVKEKVGALGGNRATIVLDRIWARLTEQPSHGIYAMGKAGQSPAGRNRKTVLDVITKAAREAGEDPDTFSGNVWAGTREHVAKTGELYGTPLEKTQQLTAGSESKSYDDLFMDRVRAKAKHLGVSVKKMESMLRKGDAELLSHILVPTTALGGGLLSNHQGVVEPSPNNKAP